MGNKATPGFFVRDPRRCRRRTGSGGWRTGEEASRGNDLWYEVTGSSFRFPAGLRSRWRVSRGNLVPENRCPTSTNRHSQDYLIRRRRFETQVSQLPGALDVGDAASSTPRPLSSPCSSSSRRWPVVRDSLIPRGRVSNQTWTTLDPRPRPLSPRAVFFHPLTLSPVSCRTWNRS